MASYRRERRGGEREGGEKGEGRRERRERRKGETIAGHSCCYIKTANWPIAIRTYVTVTITTMTHHYNVRITRAFPPL